MGKMEEYVTCYHSTLDIIEKFPTEDLIPGMVSRELIPSIAINMFKGVNCNTSIMEGILCITKYLSLII